MLMRLSHRILVTLILASILCCGGARADVEPVEVTVSVQPQMITVGDPVALTVTAVFSGGTEVSFPDCANLEAQTFEVIKEACRAPDGPLNREDGLTEQTAVYPVRLWSPGEHEINGIAVHYSTQEGEGSVSCPPVFLTVSSVGAELRGPKRPVAPPRSLFALAVGVIAVLALLSAGLAILMRRQRKGESDHALEPELTPAAWALSEISRLRESDLLSQGLFKDFHICLAEIIKVFLGRVFAFDAVEKTTGEIGAHLSDQGESPALLSRLSAFLLALDMVKFAKHRPDGNEVEQVLTEAAGIVHSCTAHRDVTPVHGET